MAAARLIAAFASMSLLLSACDELVGGETVSFYQGGSGNAISSAGLLCMMHLGRAPYSANTPRLAIQDAAAPLIQRWWSGHASAAENETYAQLAPYFVQPAVRNSVGRNDPTLLANCGSLMLSTPEMAGITF